MKCNLILFSLAAVAAVVAVGFGGCASSNDSGNRNERTVGRYIDDKVLVQRVKSALGDNQVYKFDDVKVNTYQGTVQLTGFVDTQDQKQRAEEIARNVHGVTSVQNQISMKSDTERVRGTTDQNDVNRNANSTTVTNRTTNP